MQITISYPTHRVQSDRHHFEILAEMKSSRQIETHTLAEWLKIGAFEPHTLRSAVAGYACRKHLQNGAWLNWMLRINPEYK